MERVALLLDALTLPSMERKMFNHEATSHPSIPLPNVNCIYYLPHEHTMQLWIVTKTLQGMQVLFGHISKLDNCSIMIQITQREDS